MFILSASNSWVLCKLAGRVQAMSTRDDVIVTVAVDLSPSTYSMWRPPAGDYAVVYCVPLRHRRPLRPAVPPVRTTCTCRSMTVFSLLFGGPLARPPAAKNETLKGTFDGVSLLSLFWSPIKIWLRARGNCAEEVWTCARWPDRERRLLVTRRSRSSCCWSALSV